MTLEQVERIARNLMEEHGVGDWDFAFNNRKKSVGVCKFRHKRIEIQVTHATTADACDVIDTILHEIAHVLAGKKNGHNYVWKSIAQRIGAKPERCADNLSGKKDITGAKYKAICPGCKESFYWFRRLKRMVGWHCIKCGPKNGMLVVHPIVPTQKTTV